MSWQGAGQPPPLELGDDVEGKGAVMSWEGAEEVSADGEWSGAAGRSSSAFAADGDVEMDDAAPPDGAPPPSAPPSPAHNDDADEAAGDASTAAEKLAAENSKQARAKGWYPCLWNRSGLRGVFHVADADEPSRPWEAVLPILEKEGRSVASEVFSQRSLGFFATALEAAEAFYEAAEAGKAAGECGGESMLRKDPLTALLAPTTGQMNPDMNLIFKEVDREDREDGSRDPVDLVVSERSESGYKGVHRSGGDKWQCQVYYNSTMYHVGHSTEAMVCARTAAVCARLIDVMRTRDVFESAALDQIKKGRGRDRKSDAGDGAASALVALDGEDGDLQVHSNKSAQSGFEGVYFHQHVAQYCVVAPGCAYLGYYEEAKDAVLAFSRHVASIARQLGRKYSTRPWPRMQEVDWRRYSALTLLSCNLASEGKEDETAETYTKRLDEKIELAEFVHELIGRVEELAKPQTDAAAATSTDLVVAGGAAGDSKAAALAVSNEVAVATLLSVDGASEGLLSSVPTATCVLRAVEEVRGGKAAKPPKVTTQGLEGHGPRPRALCAPHLAPCSFVSRSLLLRSSHLRSSLLAPRSSLRSLLAAF